MVVTAVPNGLMATVHNGMPVILSRESESVRLDHTTPGIQVLAPLQLYPASDLEAYPMSDLANSSQNRGRDFLSL